MKATRHDAFVPGSDVRVAPTAHGALDGLTFAVKDLIDIAGQVTGAGNPDWAGAQAPAQNHAPCVTACLDAGATVIGKTMTDELAFSLEGVNGHFGTPINPKYPDALPGGSSSGSAVAVAGGHADFALGTDTGGSVRVPGAFCGIWSIRPTHGRISLAGVTPFAPSFDTVGWFARSSEVLQRVGQVLLKDEPHSCTTPVAVATDTLDLCDPDVAEAAERVMQVLGLEHITVADRQWCDIMDTYQCLQNADIRDALASAIGQLRPTFMPDIALRFGHALTAEDCVGDHRKTRCAIASHLERVLEDRFILLPTASVTRLQRGTTGPALATFYDHTLSLGALAGLAGLPQVQFPTTSDGLAVGLSLLGAKGSDLDLIAMARRIVDRIEGPAL